MKKIEIRRAVECSDGEYRGSGNPVFVGSKEQARAFVNANPPKWPNLMYEYDEVSYQKGKEVKRKVIAGIN